jgi:hypothetical protein
MTKILGFRSEKTWKKVVATVGYLFIILIVYGMVNGKGNSTPTSTSKNSSTSSPTTPSIKQPDSTSAPAKDQTPTATPSPSLTPKSLGAGTYAIGQHITPGRYTVTTPSGAGNFVVMNKNGMPVVNEILGSSGVEKVIASLPNEGKIEISSLNKVDFTPYQPPAIETSPTKTDLCAGSFIVGTDIPKGRYVASVNGAGSGNFVVEDQSGMPKTNEILGGDMGVKNVTVDLDDTNIIIISSINDVVFVPSK